MFLLCFTLLFEGNFPSTSPQGGLYLEGQFNGGFFALPVWGPYIWTGLFLEFYVIQYNLNPWRRIHENSIHCDAELDV